MRACSAYDVTLYALMLSVSAYALAAAGIGRHAAPRQRYAQPRIVAQRGSAMFYAARHRERLLHRAPRHGYARYML